MDKLVYLYGLDVYSSQPYLCEIILITFILIVIVELSNCKSFQALSTLLTIGHLQVMKWNQLNTEYMWAQTYRSLHQPLYYRMYG